MNAHVNNMVKLVSSKLHTLSHLMKYTGPDVALSVGLYKTVGLLLPTLEYYANCIFPFYHRYKKVSYTGSRTEP